jgi:hypothetical protein
VPYPEIDAFSAAQLADGRAVTMKGKPMDERELTKLWYFADAVVRSPGLWRTFFKAVSEERDDRLVAKPSPQLQKALDAIFKALEREPKVTLETVKRMADDFLRQPNNEPTKDAGRALAAAFENNQKSKLQELSIALKGSKRRIAGAA